MKQETEDGLLIFWLIVIMGIPLVFAVRFCTFAM